MYTTYSSVTSFHVYCKKLFFVRAATNSQKLCCIDCYYCIITQICFFLLRFITTEFYARNYSVQHRLDMLDVLIESAYELSDLKVYIHTRTRAHAHTHTHTHTHTGFIWLMRSVSFCCCCFFIGYHGCREWKSNWKRKMIARRRSSPSSPRLQ